MIFSIWITAISIQVIITVLLAAQFLRYKEGKEITSEKVSIIIAARNECDNLRELIPALLKQQHTDFEIVVSLDRCTDQSHHYLKSIESVYIRVIEIMNVPQGLDAKKYALTKAIERASGNWLVFTDADCLPRSNEWLSALSTKMHAKDVLIGYSPYRNNGGLLGNLIQYESFVTAFNFLSMAILHKPYMAVGRNMVIRKAFFEKTGGYQDIQNVRGGDDDLFIQKNATRSNASVVMGAESLMYTSPEKTWSAYIAQKTRHLSVGTKYHKRDKLFHFIFNGSLFIFWFLLPFNLIFENFPVILIFLLIKFVSYKFAAGKMGEGFNYMWFPLVDFMYSIFLPAIIIRSKLVKDIRWKN